MKGEGVAGAATGESCFPLPEGRWGEMEGDVHLRFSIIIIFADGDGFYCMCDGGCSRQLSHGDPQAEGGKLKFKPDTNYTLLGHVCHKM